MTITTTDHPVVAALLKDGCTLTFSPTTADGGQMMLVITRQGATLRANGVEAYTLRVSGTLERVLHHAAEWAQSKGQEQR